MAMARRHRHMVGYRIFFVLVIPALYFLCVSILGLSPDKLKQDSGASDLNSYADPRSRRLLQIPNVSEAPEVLEALPGLQEPTLNCTAPAIKEFPSDGLNRTLRRSGLVVIHFIIAIYLFLLLAVVCDDFFVPSMKKICEKINVTEDVAGATVMAAASSSPELFINVVGTFVTQGDLGVGTIVGSAVFNVLAVPACCGLFANQVLRLEWWPVTRDAMAYAVTVLLLIITLKDGRVDWYEALVLVSFYIVYILALCYSRRMGRFFNRARTTRQKYEKLCEESPLIPNSKVKDMEIQVFESSEEDETLEIVNMVSWPSTFCERFWWILTWPINFVLLITIPDCRRPTLKTYYPLTFFMCIVWIATTSYIVGWVITIIGDTFGIPDSIMGLTFLAAGMSVPEAVSSVIVANQGHGAMGISNSIGSNVFDVLLCLGLPWFVKAAFLPTIPGHHYVKINSQGLVYSSISLFSTLLVLYVSLALAKFKLTRNVGIACLVMYAIFLAFASVLELNTFFVVNLPVCVDYTI